MSKPNLKTCPLISSKAARWLGTGLVTGLVLVALAYPLAAPAEPDATSTTASSKQLKWHTDLDAALAEAKAQNKLVLLRFTADWCAPCRVMDARVWPDSAVQAALADKYLIVKSDIDIEASYATARKYGVQGVPTLITLDGNGEEIDRAGFMSSPQLINFLETSAKTIGESGGSVVVRT